MPLRPGQWKVRIAYLVGLSSCAAMLSQNASQLLIRIVREFANLLAVHIILYKLGAVYDMTFVLYLDYELLSSISARCFARAME